LRGKAVWLNFWATTCQPCLDEMPVMQKLYDQHRDDLEIIGVSAAESPSTVLGFLRKYGYSWTFILDGGPRLTTRYRAVGLPTHVFINREGLITKLAYGELSVSQMNGYLSDVLDE
jgi:thiol-disulfide isomerase/thioredoxin